MPKNKHILLVDDDSSLRATLRACFEAVGYQCMEGKDGHDAWEWLKEGHSVDLIVIDHQMPKINGLELIKIVKSQTNTSMIPIIYYSGQFTVAQKNEAIQAGVNAVLEKPFPLQKILDLVAQICECTEE